MTLAHYNQRDDGRLLGDAPDMSDLSAFHRPGPRELQGNDDNDFATERHELHFARFPIPVDVYDGPHVADSELLARQVGRKHYPIMLFDW